MGAQLGGEDLVSPLGPLFCDPFAGLGWGCGDGEWVSALNWRLSEPSCNLRVPSQQRVCIYRFAAKIKMPRNPCSAPRKPPTPRNVQGSLSSQFILKPFPSMKQIKPPAPHPFRACFMIRGEIPGFHLLPGPAGQAACLFPGGDVSVCVPGSAPSAWGSESPRGRRTRSTRRGRPGLRDKARDTCKGCRGARERGCGEAWRDEGSRWGEG